jgi:MFS family permease
LRLLGGDDVAAAAYAWLLGAAGLLWVLASLVFATIAEPAGERDTTTGNQAAHRALRLLRDDAPFRRFVIVRGLLLVSALSPPFVVTLATDAGGSGFARLGLFIAASGLAQLVSSPVWGRAADRSSRTVMTLASASASVLAVLTVVAVQAPAVRGQLWLYPLVYLGLAIAHAGARVGRSTYVVDLAAGNRRTEYVAVSNTVIGFLLLLTGVLSSLAAAASVEAALVLLAAMGAIGAGLSRTLPETSAS